MAEVNSLINHIKREEIIIPSMFPHVTIYVAECNNGYIIMGKSSPAVVENFDAAKGVEYARNDALRQLFALEGYARRKAR